MLDETSSPSRDFQSCKKMDGGVDTHTGCGQWSACNEDYRFLQSTVLFVISCIYRYVKIYSNIYIYNLFLDYRSWSTNEKRGVKRKKERKEEEDENWTIDAFTPDRISSRNANSDGMGVTFAPTYITDATLIARPPIVSFNERILSRSEMCTNYDCLRQTSRLNSIQKDLSLISSIQSGNGEI